MTPRMRPQALPLGGILDRYLASGFLRVFFVSIAVVFLLYTAVDFFDRIGRLLGAGAGVTSIAKYFLYKSPVFISRVIGFATLFSVLFCLGMLARTQEITAMRSSGLSVQRIALPLILLAFAICGANFLWNETVVPVFAQNAQTIYRTEIRQKQQQGLLGTRDLWLRGEGSFINVDNFNSRSGVLENVTIYLLSRDFSLRGLVEIPKAQWDGEAWRPEQGTEWILSPEGKILRRETAAKLPITETPDDLKLLVREPEEFSFFDLQKRILDMKSKGMDTTAHEVDLYAKLALPLVSPLMALLALPFALKRQWSGSLSLSFGIAMLIGFSYWVLSAFCMSLGHSGALNAWLAAWLPTGIFLLIGIYFYTAED